MEKSLGPEASGYAATISNMVFTDKELWVED